MYQFALIINYDIIGKEIAKFWPQNFKEQKCGVPAKKVTIGVLASKKMNLPRTNRAISDGNKASIAAFECFVIPIKLHRIIYCTLHFEIDNGQCFWMHLLRLNSRNK